MSAAISAIIHILNRVQVDPNFAWHMVGTESLSRCITAYCFERGVDQDQFRTDLDSKIAKMQKEKKSTIELLENSIAEADQDSSQLLHEALKQSADAICRLSSVSDLLQYCQIRNAPLSIAAVELALKGQSLGRCLQELESVGV